MQKTYASLIFLKKTFPFNFLIPNIPPLHTKVAEISYILEGMYKVSLRNVILKFRLILNLI
jgi:hypothetical protein